MTRRLSLLAVAILLAWPISHVAAQFPYRGGPRYGGPISGGPVQGGGPSLFVGAYAPPYYPYGITGAGFGSTYIGAVPYTSGGGAFVMPPSGSVYYPYAITNSVAYPGARVQSPQSPSPVNPPNPSGGSGSTGETANPVTPLAGTGRAYFSVKLPADAKLLVNDADTKQAGTVRRFHTPASLQFGKTYEYTFRAQWMENNQPVTRDRTVHFKPGDDTTVDLTEATAR